MCPQDRRAQSRSVLNSAAENRQAECYQLGSALGPGRQQEDGPWEWAETDLAGRDTASGQEPAPDFFVNSRQRGGRNPASQLSIVATSPGCSGETTHCFSGCVNIDVPAAATRAPEGVNHETRDRPVPEGDAASPQLPPPYTGHPVAPVPIALRTL